jgi:NADPH-dependent ferric siderophore reductase
VLERVGLAHVEVHARSPRDQHLDAIEAQLGELAAQGAHFVLTGHSASIQRLRRLLLARDVPRARIQTKAYWAPGKTGLD